MNSRESASQVLERIFGTEPERARALVRQFPTTVIEGTTRAHAEIAAEQLREAGAKVEITERVKAAPVAVPAPAASAPSADAQWAAASAEVAWPVVPQARSSAAKIVEPVMAAEAPPRRMFNTVAMQNIEADLQRFEVADFGPPPAPARNDWADSLPPSALDGGTKSEFGTPSHLKLKMGKTAAPEIEELFAPPPPKSMQQGVGAHGLKGKADKLDLFSPPGADNYFKSKADPSNPGRGPAAPKDGSTRGLSPRGEDKAWRPPADKSLGRGTLEGDAGVDQRAQAAGKTTLKSILTKAVAGWWRSR